MCLHANVFVPKKERANIVIPPTFEGLKCTIAESIQEDLSRFVDGMNGTALDLHDGHCLCSFTEWDDLFEYVHTLRKENDAYEIYMIIYWTDDSYSDLNQITYDVELDEMTSRPAEGTIYRIAIDVSRRLEAWICKQVVVYFKDGRQVSGLIKIFTPDNGNGMLEEAESFNSIYFNEKEIKKVEILRP